MNDSEDGVMGSLPLYALRRFSPRVPAASGTSVQVTLAEVFARHEIKKLRFFPTGQNPHFPASAILFS
jgi:hypothetical protein